MITGAALFSSGYSQLQCGISSFLANHCLPSVVLVFHASSNSDGSEEISKGEQSNAVVEAASYNCNRV